MHSLLITGHARPRSSAPCIRRLTDGRPAAYVEPSRHLHHKADLNPSATTTIRALSPRFRQRRSPESHHNMFPPSNCLGRRSPPRPPCGEPGSQATGRRRCEVEPRPAAMPTRALRTRTMPATMTPTRLMRAVTTRTTAGHTRPRAVRRSLAGKRLSRRDPHYC
jgi:hypothetical protein